MSRLSVTLGLLCMCLVFGCCTAKSVLRPVPEKRDFRTEARMEGHGLQLEERPPATDDKPQLAHLAASPDFTSDQRGMSPQTSPGLRKKRAFCTSCLQNKYNDTKKKLKEQQKQDNEKPTTLQPPRR